MQLSAQTSPARAPAALPLRRAQFGSLYQTYVTRVYGFVFTHVGNREDAEDVTSQIFVTAYKNLDRFEGRGFVENWLFRIARTAVADFWRERYKLPSVPLSDDWDIPSPDGVREFDSSAREQRVQDLLGRLPPNYRDVLVQRFLRRSSISETAHTLGITEANTRVLQFRALRRAADLARDWGW